VTVESIFPPDPIEQITPDGRKVFAYSADTLISLWQGGMKLAPTFANGLAFNIKDLCTEEEFTAYPKCSQKPLRLIYLNPDFWTIERLQKESWRFEGVRCLPGKTFIRDQQGNKIGNARRLFILDIDSPLIYKKCRTELETEWMPNTYVTKTLKTFGHHIYWFEDWRDSDDFVTIDYNDAKPDAQLEIFVGVQYTQVLGRHRNHPQFTYANVGCRALGRFEIMHRNGMYAQLLEMFKEVVDLDAIKKRQKLQQKNKDPFYRHLNLNGSKDQIRSASSLINLTPHQSFFAASWAEEFYEPGKHYAFMRPFLGTLVWSRINQNSVWSVIDKICQNKGDLSSGNKQKWYNLVADAYQRIQDGANVEGKHTLNRALQRNFSLSEEQATERINMLMSLFMWIGPTDQEKEKEKEKASQSDQQTNTNDSSKIEDFLSKVPNQNPLGYAIHVIEKTVKQDTSLVKLITYTGLSAYTSDPLNLAIIAPTAEGKTHPVEQTISKFCPEDVQRIGTMSPKVLIRQDGILVNEKNESIQDEVNQLKLQMKDKDAEDLETLKLKLEELYKTARCLIDLRNKIYVFYEPPDRGMWDILKPILSHDTEYMTHNYVYDVPGIGHPVKKIVTRGWPAVIFCSAGGKNELTWPEWPEITSRCFVVSPNMVAEKYHQSNFLISQRKSLPRSVQDKIIVSNREITLAQECIEFIKSQTIDRNLSTWIPYGQILGNILPSEKGIDVRAFRRMISLLNTIPLFDADLRPKMIFQETKDSQTVKETCVVATLSDLEEVFDLVLDTSALPQWKMKIFREIFCTKYKKEGRDITVQDILDHYYEKRGKKVSSNTIKSHLIPEWVNNSLVDVKTTTTINDGKEVKLTKYHPLIEVDDTTGITLRSPKIPDTWLESEILWLCYDGTDGSFRPERIKFQDIDGSKMQNNDFIAKYNESVKDNNQNINGLKPKKLAQLLTYKNDEKHYRSYKHITDLEILGNSDRLPETEVNEDSFPPSTSFPTPQLQEKGAVIPISSPALVQIQPHLPYGAQNELLQEYDFSNLNSENNFIEENQNRFENTLLQTQSNLGHVNQTEQISTECSYTYKSLSPVCQNKANLGSLENETGVPGGAIEVKGGALDLQGGAIEVKGGALDLEGGAMENTKSYTRLTGILYRQIINLTKEGKSQRQIARLLSIDHSTVNRILQKVRQNSVTQTILSLNPNRYRSDVLFYNGHGRGLILKQWSVKAQPLSIEPISNLVEKKSQELIVSSSQQHLILQPPQQQSPFIPTSIPIELVDSQPSLGKFATFDCEWYREDLTENREKGIAGNIYAFCLIDSYGRIEKLHVNQFVDRQAFMSAILDIIGRYTTLAGYAILDSKKNGRDFISDIGHIHTNCYQVGLQEKYGAIRCNLLDLYKIYHNEAVDGFLKAAYKMTYRGESLDDVAQAFLGKGKTEGVTGINVESLTHEERLAYCVRDAQLCYELLQQKDFELLQILYEISQEIKLDFFETCNVQWPTKRWACKLTSIGYQHVSSDVKQWIDDNTVLKTNGTKKGVVAMGGYVFPPKTGYHINAISYDVVSMYPSMINVHNISTETINCPCCKDDPKALVPSEVMESINAYILDKENKAKKQEPRPWHYWICRRQRGQLSKVMADLIKRKKEYKKSDQTLKEKAIKILMNSGYGCFKQPYFDYHDPRVAELTTAFGQYTVKGFAKFIGDENVIYGDTDSIYFTAKNDALVAKAAEINVDLEVDKEWKILCLSSNKKQYFGITQQGVPDNKTLTGMKSDHPAYFKQVTEKLISKEFQESFITSASSASEKIVTYVRSALVLLETEGSINIENLAYSAEASKNLYEYTSNCKEQKIYREILEDCGGDVELAQSKSQGSNVYRYWKIQGVKGKGKSVTTHPERYQLDISKYKTELFTCIKPILAAYGIKDFGIYTHEYV
jgi:hypothetical protein